MYQLLLDVNYASLFITVPIVFGAFLIMFLSKIIDFNNKRKIKSENKRDSSSNK